MLGVELVAVAGLVPDRWERGIAGHPVLESAWVKGDFKPSS